MNYKNLKVYFDSGRYEDAIRLAGADPYSISELSRLVEALPDFFTGL